MAINHSVVIARFEEFIAENGRRQLNMRELCAATGTNEHTLRTCCHERLGTTPSKYVRLHRLKLVHEALQTADPSTTSVTQIAAEYGFSEFGRFAAEYRKLFGERPSASLYRTTRKSECSANCT